MERQPRRKENPNAILETKTSQFQEQIVATLSGKTEEFREIPPGHVDFEGMSVFRVMYDNTSGMDRTAIIAAMGRVIEDPEQQPEITVQVVQLINALDLTQLEPSIIKLQTQPAGSNEFVQRGLITYFANKELARRKAAGDIT